MSLRKIAPLMLAPLLLPTAALGQSWSDFDPTDAYRARQAEYLEACAQSNGPGQGSVYGQVCVLMAGDGQLNRTKFDEALAEINAREDTADFELNGLLRLMALEGDNPRLPADLKADIEDAVLNFKYWLDEPGPDTMCWWSENHQILFHAAELVAGQLYPDEVFTNSGMTGRQHVEHAKPLIEEWLRYRMMFGFSEWHSNVYLNEDIPALVNIVDFAWDETIASRAAMVLDLVAFDFANNFYKGLLTTPFGRTYQSKLLGGLNDSISEAAWIMLGVGDWRSASNFSGVHLATSTRYWPAPTLEAVALESLDHHENRQRDGFDLDEGPDYGISYSDYDDVVRYWGMGAYVASPVIYWTFETVEHYDLWEDFFWGTVPFLQPLVGKRWLGAVSNAFDEMTRGAALEGMSTYSYRTPDYQLTGSQNQEMGLWAAQAHFWRAVIDKDAYVFTTAPGGQTDDYAYGPWTGGWTPHLLLNKNVALVRYDRDDYIALDGTLFVEYTHAYFARSAFDEVVQQGQWTFGRKGEAYVGLWSQRPTEWATGDTQDYELIADGTQNVWITELGSAQESGSFAAFMQALSQASISVGISSIEYHSPSQGLLQGSTRGTLTVNNVPVDVGPYKRWDNRWAQHDVGTELTVIDGPASRLTLDMTTATRRYEETLF